MNEISSTLTGEIYTKKHKSGVTNIFIGEKETVSKIKKKKKIKVLKVQISHFNVCRNYLQEMTLLLTK